MSVGAIGSGNVNAALWAKIEKSMLDKTSGDGIKSETDAPAASPPAYHGVTGASPGGNWSKLNVMG